MKYKSFLCKCKTEALAIQQGYKPFLIGKITVAGENKLETMWDTNEAETDPVKQKQEKMYYLNQKVERKINASASCMLMMSVPAALCKKLERYIDEPRKIFEIICDKYYNKGNNKLSNLFREFKICTLKSTKVNPDEWFNDLSHLNNRIEKIELILRRQKNSWQCTS